MSPRAQTPSAVVALLGVDDEPAVVVEGEPAGGGVEEVGVGAAADREEDDLRLDVARPRGPVSSMRHTPPMRRADVGAVDRRRSHVPPRDLGVALGHLDLVVAAAAPAHAAPG